MGNSPNARAGEGMASDPGQRHYVVLVVLLGCVPLRQELASPGVNGIEMREGLISHPPHP
jgi:hypothetical protein